MTARQPDDAGERMPVPADNQLATYQSATYIILTALRPDSGLIIGGVRSVAYAEINRRVAGAGTRDALVAVYVRLADALVPVDVEATELSSVNGFARHRVRTWLQQQLISQCEVETPLEQE
ncbi:hypothetical protein ACI2K4_29570 [Micromonospora sp. NPDC050397]|uniref:hypothetical protein n=1 Tax=Micromonospora sp. NPDC050397 TaxID=3364279 RepID=UPI003851741D